MNQMLSAAFRAVGSFSIQCAQIKKTSTRAIRPITKVDIPDIMNNRNITLGGDNGEDRNDSRTAACL